MESLTDLVDEISAQLRTERFGRPLEAHARVTSTNDLARKLAAGGAEEGTAVLALEQSRGRGRLGRTWQSPPGGLYLSIVLRPVFSVERWPLIGLALALGAAVAAERQAGAPVRLKWPNDLLMDGRKLGGILVETASDAAVCGIGLNVILPSKRPAAPEPAEAAWLADRNPSVSLVDVVQDVLLGCERRYDSLSSDPAATLTEWRTKSVTLGRRVYVESAPPVEGVAEDIDAGGALLVRTCTGVRRVLAGDIVLSELGR